MIRSVAMLFVRRIFACSHGQVKAPRMPKTGVLYDTEGLSCVSRHAPAMPLRSQDANPDE